MNKYIDADKLITEIDRQEIGYNTDGKHTAEYNTCRKILSIINSLQQEQPPLPSNLDEAAERIVMSLVPTLGQKYEDGSYVQGTRDYFSRDELIGLVKAGAEWMAEQGEFYEGKIQVSMRTGDLIAVATVPDEKYNFNDKVVVQIRKAE